MQEIIIRFRSRAFVSLAIVAVAATTLFAWLYVDRVRHQPEGEIDVIRSVYMGLTVGFGILMVRAFISLFSKKPAMVINNTGITDHTNLYGTTIKWENVIRAELTKFGTSKIMAVYINNFDEVASGLKRSKQRMAVAKTKRTGTPIILSINLYDFDPQATVDLINNKTAETTIGA